MARPTAADSLWGLDDDVQAIIMSAFEVRGLAPNSVAEPHEMNRTSKGLGTEVARARTNLTDRS